MGIGKVIFDLSIVLATTKVDPNARPPFASAPIMVRYFVFIQDI